MSKSHVFSLRVSDPLNEKIEKIVSSHIWWKRNSIVTRILECVCDCADYDAIFKMLQYRRYNIGKFRIKIEYDGISEDKSNL